MNGNNIPLLGQHRAPVAEGTVIVMMMPSADGHNMRTSTVRVPASLFTGLVTMQSHADLQQFQQAVQGAIGGLLNGYQADLDAAEVPSAPGQTT